MTTARPAPLDDRSLMHDVQSGKASALTALYERTAPVLYPLALRITGAAERASSVLEELFDEVWRDRAKLRPALGIPVGAMILRCRELALAHVGPGEEPRRPMTVETGPAAAALPAAEATIALVAVEDLGPFVSRQAAYDALRALPESDRVALEEAFFCGRSAREIAAMVGAPTSEAEAALRTALVRFRNHIGAPHGVDSFDGLEAGTGTAG
jgi:RNA polymerase sigma-70 factor, ECF subfamily